MLHWSAVARKKHTVALMGTLIGSKISRYCHHVDGSVGVATAFNASTTLQRSFALSPRTITPHSKDLSSAEPMKLLDPT